MNRTLNICRNTCKRLALAAAFILLGGVAQADDDHEHDHEHDEEQHVTVWEDGIEVFASHLPLIAGERAQLTAYLTLLDGYRVVEDGALSAQLRGEDGSARPVNVEGPLGRGIFLLGVTPAQAGEQVLELTLERAPRTHRAALALTVYASENEVPHDHGDEDIAFTKAQQWMIPFATSAVTEEAIAPRITAPALVEAMPGQRADVVAPTRGTLQLAGERAWPHPGQRVRRGEALAALLPLSGVDDMARLASETDAARQRMTVADTALERIRQLVTEGIAAERRLIEAEAEAATARSAWQALRGRLDALQGQSGAALLLLRAPFDGVVMESALAPGQIIDAGARIATVIDDRRMGIRVQLLAADLATLNDPQDLRLRRPGSRQWEQPASLRLVYRSAALDESGVFSLLYETHNDGSWVPGLPLIASLAVEQPQQLPTVPAEAVIDDDGVSVVIVQHGGEDFERRQVRIGTRAAGRIAVLDGLSADERVVTRGAYAVMLAGRGPMEADAHHGHSH